MHISKAELKLLRSLSQRKQRELQKKFVVEGWRALKDALNAGVPVDFVAMTRRYHENGDYASYVREIEQRNIGLKELTEAELQAVSDTVHSQGVVALVHQSGSTIDDIDLEKASLLVVADRITDPGNLGSLVRTSDWFGVDALILSEGCVDLYNEKVVRSTVGSMFHIPVVEGAGLEQTLPSLKRLGFSLVGTSADASVSYSKFTFSTKTALILGSEAAGLSPSVRTLCDDTIRINRNGKAESLNVVVACGVLLSHFRNRS